jgi:uracil phosphoribosyltransferase
MNNAMVINLGEQHSVANEFLRELRDKNIQQDRQRFRRNMERLGEIMAYEISKKLKYQPTPVTSPLGVSSIALSVSMPVLVTVLRAGLPYFHGFLNYFDRSDCGFIGAYRDEHGKDQITINLEYVATSPLKDREVIVIDPMLATGKSFIRAVNALQKNGQPSHIHIAALVASPEGIAFVENNIQVPHTLWTFAIDEKLNHQFYIVPGLGDAGDLSFGNKI